MAINLNKADCHTRAELAEIGRTAAPGGEGTPADPEALDRIRRDGGGCDCHADRLTFWRNWFDGVDSFPDDMRLAWYDSVLRYAFLGIEPARPSPSEPLSAIRWNAVQMVRATIEISRKKSSNGSKRKAKRKQNGSKPKANAKQVQEQVEVEEEDKGQYATPARTREGRRWSVEQFIAMGVACGVPEEFCREIHADLEDREWINEDGRPAVTSPRNYLKTAWNNSQKKFRAARERGEGQAVGQSWDLEGVV